MTVITETMDSYCWDFDGRNGRPLRDPRRRSRHHRRYRRHALLSCLREVTGHLSINNSATRTDLRGLESLERVGGTLNVYNNAMLVSLDGLDGLVEVGDSFQISTNPMLVDIRALSGVEALRAFQVQDNDSLTDLTSLATVAVFSPHSDSPNLEPSIHIDNNDSLSNLDGLSFSTRIGLMMQRSYDY